MSKESELQTAVSKLDTLCDTTTIKLANKDRAIPKMAVQALIDAANAVVVAYYREENAKRRFAAKACARRSE